MKVVLAARNVDKIFQYRAFLEIVLIFWMMQVISLEFVMIFQI